MVDSTLVSDTVAYHHWNGKVDKEWQRKAVNHIFSMQLPDGGWNIYYGGPSEVNATIKAYLALKLAGVPVTDPRMLRAREVALHLGGVPRMNTFSKLYLALLGLFPWEYVPTIPCEVMLIGKWFHVNFWDMSNWSRAMLVPLAIINHFKPTRPVNGGPGRAVSRRHPRARPRAGARPGNDFVAQFLPLAGPPAQIRRMVRRAQHPSVPQARAARNASNGCSNGSKARTAWRRFFPAMLNSLIALKALGLSRRPSAGRPRRARAEEARARNRDTTCASSRASRRSGTRPSSPSACTNPAFRKIIPR